MGDDQELTLCYTHDRVRRAGVLAQAARRFAHHIVTHMVAERAVDLAHVAHVDENQRRGDAWLGIAHQLFEPPLGERAVGQAGDRIVIDLMRDIGFALRDRTLHGVERSRQTAELVAPRGLDGDFVAALLDAMRSFDQQADGAGGTASEQCAGQGCERQGDAIDQQ